MPADWPVRGFWQNAFVAGLQDLAKAHQCTCSQIGPIFFAYLSPFFIMIELKSGFSPSFKLAPWWP